MLPRKTTDTIHHKLVYNFNCYISEKEWKKKGKKITLYEYNFVILYASLFKWAAGVESRVSQINKNDRMVVGFFFFTNPSLCKYNFSLKKKVQIKIAKLVNIFGNSSYPLSSCRNSLGTHGRGLSGSIRANSIAPEKILGNHAQTGNSLNNLSIIVTNQWNSKLK